MDRLELMFGALADPTRRAVVERLSRGPASVSELAKPFRIALPSFLQHLRVLERGGWIRSDKRGRVRTCRLRPAALKSVAHWVARQRALWKGRTDRLEGYLRVLQNKERKP